MYVCKWDHLEHIHANFNCVQPYEVHKRVNQIETSLAKSL